MDAAIGIISADTSPRWNPTYPHHRQTSTHQNNRITPKNMPPIESATPASPDPKSPMAPPYVDDDVNLESVEHGSEIAESERREAAALQDPDATMPADDSAPLAAGGENRHRNTDETDLPPEIRALHIDGGSQAL
jgi:hypothetical protein